MKKNPLVSAAPCAALSATSSAVTFAASAALFAALLAASPAARAIDFTALQGTGYFGASVGVGQPKWTNASTTLDGRVCPSGSFECKDSPTAFKLFAGYMFAPTWGVDLTYYYVDKVRFKFNSVSGGLPATITQDVQIDGIALSAVGAIPLGNFQLIGRVGVASSRTSRSDQVQTAIQILDGSAEHTRPAPLFGASIAYRFTNNTALRFDWDQARAETDFKEKFRSDLFTLGLSYSY